MLNQPTSVPCPDKPPLHLRGGYLCVAAPLDFTEACFSAPAVRALRAVRPHSTMAVVCPASQEALWSVMPELNDVVVYADGASSSQIAAAIKAQTTTFESSIAWEPGPVAKAFKQTKIHQRLGYPARELLRFLTDEVDVVHKPGPIQHRVRYYLDFVNRLCGKAYIPASFRTPELPAVSGGRRIILSPNSSYGASHEWAVENFYEVVKLMKDRYNSVEWLIISDFIPLSSERKENQGPCARLKELLADESVELIREDTLHNLIKNLQQSSAFLGCDGELAHLAAHLGLPATVIFGPNEPALKRPLGKQSSVLREHVACSPCYLKKCPIDHRCQTAITVEMAVEKLEGSLKLRRKVD